MAQVIPDAWQVPARIRQRVGVQAGRQRAIVEEGHLLLILHELPKDDEVTRPAKLFWRAPDGTWRATGAGQSSGLPVLKRHLETVHQALVQLDDRVDAGKTAQDFFTVLNAATPLHRTSRNLHKALQDARDAVDDREIIALRDSANDLERAAELLVGDARNGMEFTVARNAEAQAANGQRAVEAGHKLNLLAALFFPVTAIGSMLGMNLRTGMEQAPPVVFWLVLVLAFASGFAIRSSLEKK
jgi:hypothetical protein